MFDRFWSIQHWHSYYISELYCDDSATTTNKSDECNTLDSDSDPETLGYFQHNESDSEPENFHISSETTSYLSTYKWYCVRLAFLLREQVQNWDLQFVFNLFLLFSFFFFFVSTLNTCILSPNFSMLHVNGTMCRLWADMCCIYAEVDAHIIQSYTHPTHMCNHSIYICSLHVCSFESDTYVALKAGLQNDARPCVA